MNSNFGSFLSEKRREVGLTQKQLADKMFVSESTISKWETNIANPDISMITDLARILKVSEHELINASIDNSERKEKKDARKWNIFTKTWNLIFLISYGITLLTCFICDLASDGILSWFFIVLTSIVLAASFTTLPRYIKKYRLLLISLIELVCTLILFAVCCIYTKTNWFLLAAIPTLVGFVIVFLPLYIKEYNFPMGVKKNNAIISVIVDIVLILVMELILCLELHGNWFVNFALPLTLYVAIIPVIFVIVLRYIRINSLIKASILTFVFAPFLAAGYFISKNLCLKALGVAIDEIQLFNFLDWTTRISINSNVYWLIIFSILFAAIVLLVIYFIKKNKKK